ncbi:MAG: glycosyltransferase [Bacteroidales bacterium]|nr:glycosyltransferase [Bacteroidales bacterium]
MKIFILLPRFPYPLEKGDKLRAYNHIRFLSKNNEIFLCALSDFKLHEDTIPALKPYCKSIEVIQISKFSIFINLIKAFLSGKPLQVGYFFNSKAKKKIDLLIKNYKPGHIFCQLIRVAEYVKNSEISKTLDYQDVFSRGVYRRIATSPFYMRPLLKFEYKRLLKYEKDIFTYFDNKTIISKPDRNFIPHPEKEKIHVIINGVDTDFYKPIKCKKENDLVFIGNMGYPPNINAAEFLAKKVLPIVHKTYPEIKLLLAGANPHSNVLALKSDKVQVTGWVKDIRNCYAKARIFIAPMQIGTGLQNKLLEAMAMKIPCITSQLANNALEAKENNEILIAFSPEEYAKQIIYLLENKEKAEQIAQNAYNFVINNFNWENATKNLDNIINS